MKEFDRKILANNIKELRRNKNLNQVELAKKLNVSQQTVGAWETGRSIPGSDTLDVLADFFNVSTDYLLGRNTPKVSSNDDTALTWKDLKTPMPYDGRMPEELTDIYVDIAKSFFKHHPEYLNKNREDHE